MRYCPALKEPGRFLTFFENENIRPKLLTPIMTKIIFVALPLIKKESPSESNTHKSASNMAGNLLRRSFNVKFIFSSQ